jgi:hypothetical protein
MNSKYTFCYLLQSKKIRIVNNDENQKMTDTADLDGCFARAGPPFVRQKFESNSPVPSKTVATSLSRPSCMCDVMSPFSRDTTDEAQQP